MNAAQLMTDNPRTIRVDDTLADALELLQSMAVRHLPVVDEHGDLVGMLSDRDVAALARSFTEGEDATRTIAQRAGTRVAAVMSADPVCVDPDADAAEVIERMLENRIGAVPVVDGDGTVVGIISYIDVLRAMSAVLRNGAAAA